jgi:geranylgeranyl reductase family protein
MDSCDALIVGGGPAGSSCAWGLRRSGLEVAILDRQRFPRNKVCGGWITPAVLEELEIDPAEYGRSRVLQPITGFRTSYVGGPVVETRYGGPVSYGVRRFEFDDYLLRRSGARILEPAPLARLERSGDGWIVNGELRARMLIGAGGTFCPVARFLGAKVSGEIVVTAQEAEVEVDSECAIRGEIPELYFCSDMKGYGWCFRKGNVVNVGLGRLDPHGLSTHSAEFLKFLRAEGRLPRGVSAPLAGHAYLLQGNTSRTVVADGVALVGDAAGVAYAQSGEGIRPAIESGLLAAKVVAQAEGRYTRDRLGPYRALLRERNGANCVGWAERIGRGLPTRLAGAVARRLLATEWFTRGIVLDRWFLRRNEGAVEL